MWPRFGSYLALARSKAEQGQSNVKKLQKALTQELAINGSARMLLSSFLVKQELPPVTNYFSHVELIKNNRGVLGDRRVGQKRKNWYLDVARILSAELGCELVTFPGHHSSYMDVPNEFADRIDSILQKVDRVYLRREFISGG